MKLRILMAVAIFVATAGCDAATKVAAQAGLADGPVALVAGSVELRLAYNTGAAFSSFMGAPSWALAGVAVGVLLGVCAWMWRSGVAETKLGASAMALVAAGGLANAVDRLADGRVTDMIVVRGWPGIFNVADVAIVVGAVGVALVAGAASRDGSGRRL